LVELNFEKDLLNSNKGIHSDRKNLTAFTSGDACRCAITSWEVEAMTLAMAWTRKVGHTVQLWFVSDSRLSGGRAIDHAPKIMPLSRRDSAISFGGSTDVAFPMMMAMALAVEHHAPARERAMDIVELKSHTIKVFNHIVDAGLTTEVPELEDPDAEFILGGYSWRNQRYELWEIAYNRKDCTFEAQPARAVRYVTHPGKVAFTRDRRLVRRSVARVAFAGDWKREAAKRLRELLASRVVDKTAVPLLEFEPFEVVRDLLREAPRDATIGGAPQVVRIDQHINSRPIAVFWPSRQKNRVTLLGRPSLEYENLDSWILDPDSLEISHPRFSDPGAAMS